MPELIPFSWPILTTVCFLPLLGALWIALLVNRERENLGNIDSLVTPANPAAPGGATTPRP